MDVKPRTWDVAGLPATVKFLHAFFTGRDMTRAAKARAPGRKAIAVPLPVAVPEIVVACGAIPVSMARCGAFTHKNSDVLLRRITTTVRALGWSAVGGMLKLACFTRTGADVVDLLVENLLTAQETWENACMDEGARLGLGARCASTRWMAGMAALACHEVDAAVTIPLHACTREKPVNTIMSSMLPNHAFIALHDDGGHVASHEAIEQRLFHVLDHVSRVAGGRFDEGALAGAIEQANVIKATCKELMHVLATSDTLPTTPHAISHVQRLLSLAMLDFNSNPRAFASNIAAMIGELLDRIQRGDGPDSIEHPLLFCTHAPSGMDHVVIRAATAAGARVMFGEHEVVGSLDPIPRKNPVARLAAHLARVASSLDLPPVPLSKRVVACAREFGAKGILVLDGCNQARDGNFLEILEALAGSHGMPLIITPPPGMDPGGSLLSTTMEEFVTFTRMA